MKNITKSIRTKSKTIRTKKEKQKLYLVGGATAAIIAALALTFVLFFFAMAPPAEEEALGRAIIYDQRTGANISGTSTINVYNPTSSDAIETFGDIYDPANWELGYSGLASELAIDFTNTTGGIWLQVVKSGYETDWFYMSKSSEQHDIKLYIHDRPSDLIFENFVAGGFEIALPDPTESDFRINTFFPTGEGATCLIRPVFNLSANTYDFSDATIPVFGQMTNAFAFKFTANNTISLVNGNPNQINVTLSSTYSPYWDVIIDGAAIYFVSVGVLYDEFKLEYTMECGINATNSIKINTIVAGFVSIPGLDIASFTSY